LRISLATRIQNAALDTLQYIVFANELMHDGELEQRISYQAQALTSCRLLLVLIDVSLERGLIDTRRAEYWAGLALEVKTMLTAWRKKDISRKA